MFPADALEANRAGRLTDVQRHNLGGRAGGFRKGELQFAAILAVMGLLVWFAPGPANYANIKPVLGIAFLVIAGALAIRAFLGSDALTQDLRSGRVLSEDGPISKQVVSAGRDEGASRHYIWVNRVRVETGLAFYSAAPEAGIVKIYYLPHSHRLVNLEQLPDRPLPAGALEDPRRTLHDLAEAGKGSLFGDTVREAEARAELAAMGHVMSAEFVKSGTVPPGEQRDPRPLAEAILGTWKNMMMTVDFAPDGTATASMAGGQKMSGRWSVDPSGRLVSDIAPGGEAADAWVAQDHLTIVMGGQGLVFSRVGGQS